MDSDIVVDGKLLLEQVKKTVEDRSNQDLMKIPTSTLYKPVLE